jgi:uncharacterized protein (TIGR02118 family)
MVKQIFLLKRKSGLSFEEFKKYYLEKHAPLVKNSFPEIRQYRINFVLQRGKETPFDAITEICWDNLESLKKLAQADIYKNSIIPDEEKFIDRKNVQVILTEEYLQK